MRLSVGMSRWCRWVEQSHREEMEAERARMLTEASEHRSMMEAEQARLVVESRQLREEMQARARAKAAASACRCLARCARSMQMHAWSHWLARNDAMMRACGTIGRSLLVMEQSMMSGWCRTPGPGEATARTDVLLRKLVQRVCEVG